MNVVLASNDPKYNDPILGAQVTGGSWSTGMNFDTMCRAGAAGRLTLIKAAAEMMGVPESELRARESRVHHAKSKKSLTYAQIVQSGKANKVWSPDELKAISSRRRTNTPRSASRCRNSTFRQRPTAPASMASTRAYRACSTASSRFRRCATARR